MEKIGVVVLNYKNYNETINCVNSLLGQSNVDLEIVIVENGSNNDSEKVLNLTYKNNEYVSVISSNNNLGYAKGNNLGIDYLRDKGIENILLANSDTIFENSKIISEMMNFNKENVGLIVPTIHNLDGSINRGVVYKKNFLYLRVLKNMIIEEFSKPSASKTNNPKSENVVNNAQKLNDDSYIVTGSAFLLTSNFFKYYNGLFPKTFLYYEEIASILLLHKANLISLVVDTHPILHIGAASTPENIKTKSSARKKINRDSAKKVFKLLLTPKTLAKKFY